MLEKLLTSIETQKVITGVEKDCFRCLSIEVFPEIDGMVKYCKEYILDKKSEYVEAWIESDRLLVVGWRVAVSCALRCL